MGDSVHSKAVLALSTVLVLCHGAVAQAQPAYRVKDLNTTRSAGIASEFGPNLYLDGYAAVGGTVFFGASDGIHGHELWRSDGTVAGTRLVADVCPGSCSSIPRNFAAVGNQVFFEADDGFHGLELWKSDGTAAGTALVRDLIPPSNLAIEIHGLTALNGKLLFAVSPYNRSHELWTSDGTAAGTVRLKAFGADTSSNNLEPLARLGGKVFFVAPDQDHGRELWMTDGTAAGTVLLKDVNPGPSGSAAGNPERTAAVAGGKLFFLATSPNEGYELRVSDGTPAGTALIKDVVPGPASYIVSDLTAWGREVYFFASVDGQKLELWKSDGTAGGTRAVQTIPGRSRSLTQAGNQLFFLNECELWKSDGTAAGTGLVMEVQGTSFCDPPYALSGGNGQIVFFANDGVHGKEPWRSDGTPSGTFLLADLNPGSASSAAFTRDVFAGGRWYFRALGTEAVGLQLWTSDGSPSGTRMLEINRQRSGFQVGSRGTLVGPRAFFDFGGTLLFQGGDGASGAELGRSDGTAAGTFLIKDLRPGPEGSQPGEFTLTRGTLFFRSGAGTGLERLWKTDGTAQGTQTLYAPVHLYSGGLFSPRDLTPLGSQLLFTASAGEDFLEVLMKSDGTPEGTARIEAAAYVNHVESIVSLNAGRTLFQADGDLWRSDGTEAGTAPIATAPSLDRGRVLADVSAVRDGVLYFSGSTPANGEELWRSDGTEAGTRLFAEFVPGPGSKRLGPFATAGSAVFFAVDGNELWKTDAAGTVLVRRLPPGDPAFGIRSLTTLGKKVFFTYHDNARGNELWTSDGTEAGTRIVKDLQPGRGSSNPRELHAEGAVLLFSATDGVHGFEPWRSDGTRRGTLMIQDIAPGELSSSPTEFTASGSKVYFTANDGTTGFELWAMPRP